MSFSVANQTPIELFVLLRAFHPPSAFARNPLSVHSPFFYFMRFKLNVAAVEAKWSPQLVD